MSAALEAAKAVGKAIGTVAEFIAGLCEVCFRGRVHDDGKHHLSPESQRIQDMWHSGDFDGYNAAVNRMERARRAAGWRGNPEIEAFNERVRIMFQTPSPDDWYHRAIPPARAAVITSGHQPSRPATSHKPLAEEAKPPGR